MTVSGFVVHDDRVALHWHRKIGGWMPAGGHIEAGEDPVEAVLREVREEFALEAEVLPVASRVRYDGGPTQVEPPYTVLLCRVEPDHEHVDMVYFLRAVSGYPGQSHDPENPIEWVDEQTLVGGTLTLGSCGADVPFAPDIRALALEALSVAARAGTVSR